MDYFDFDNDKDEDDGSPVWQSAESEPWRMPDTYGSPRIGFYAAARATFIVLVQLTYYLFLLVTALVLLSAVVETTRSLVHRDSHQLQQDRTRPSDEHNHQRSRRPSSQSRPRARSRVCHTEIQDKSISENVSNPWDEAPVVDSELKDDIEVKIEPGLSTALSGSYEFDTFDNFDSSSGLVNESTTQTQGNADEPNSVVIANRFSSHKNRSRLPTPYKIEPSQYSSNAAAGYQPTMFEPEPSQRRRTRNGTPYPETPIVKYKGQLPSPETFNNPAPQGMSDIVVGDWVHRLRPAPTILKGTSDEEDLYDGPWKVLEIQRRHKVQHTPMVRRTSRAAASNGAGSLIPSARLAIPADSLLKKTTEGWTPLDQLVKMGPILGKSQKEMSSSSAVYHDHNGEKYYSIEKVRGVRSDISKSANTPASNSPKISRAGVKTYLVHWAGYPSEDDSWEKGHTHQYGGVPADIIDEWKQRENAWKAAQGVKAKAQQKGVKPIQRFNYDNIDEVDD